MDPDLKTTLIIVAVVVFIYITGLHFTLENQRYKLRRLSERHSRETSELQNSLTELHEKLRKAENEVLFAKETMKKCKCGMPDTKYIGKINSVVSCPSSLMVVTPPSTWSLTPL